MDGIDLVTMLENLSRSLFSVQRLITGLGYLLGIVFIINALYKTKSTFGSKGGAHGSIAEPLGYFIMGVALLYLPSTLDTVSATFFGSNNILQYSKYNAYDIYSAMRVLIQTIGIIWFIRGCVLLVHATHPSAQKGHKGDDRKGLLFLIAGIFAVHFDTTLGALNYAFNVLMTWVW